MKTILVVESDEERIWEIIEKVNVYNKHFKNLNIASNENIAKQCIDLYGFDVMIINSSCKKILDYIEENCKSNDEKIIIILNELGDNRKNNYSFDNKVIELSKLDNELRNIFSKE